MPKYRIAVLPGDGVGVDVMDAAFVVLDRLALDAEYIKGEVGWEFWKKEGNALPERTVELIKSCDCTLFGAITSKPKDEAAKELDPSLKGKGFVYYSPIVKLRQIFDLYINMRPCKAFKGNPLNYKDNIDLVVFRENTEGLYSGVEFRPFPDEIREAVKKHSSKMAKFDFSLDKDIAVSLRIITRRSARRIIRAAFEYARENNRRSVTLVEKPNVLRETSGLMRDVFREIQREYPEIEHKEANIDAMMMWLVKNPENYDVLVTSNLFGDITSDLSAQLVGGLGFASSANIGDTTALFEPTHGSAPKYAGKYKVNPIAMLLSVKLMLDYIGEKQMAKRLETAIADVIAEGKVRTYDMGGNASTMDIANAIAERL